MALAGNGCSPIDTSAPEHAKLHEPGRAADDGEAQRAGTPGEQSLAQWCRPLVGSRPAANSLALLPKEPLLSERSAPENVSGALLFRVPRDRLVSTRR